MERCWENPAGKESQLPPARGLPKHPLQNKEMTLKFPQYCCSTGVMRQSLETLESCLREVAATFYDLDIDTDNPLKRLPGQIRDLRQQARFETDGPTRKSYFKQLWSTMRLLSRQVSIQRLQSMKKLGSKDLDTLSALKINGQWSYDRQEWLRSAHLFGQQRFADSNP